MKRAQLVKLGLGLAAAAVGASVQAAPIPVYGMDPGTGGPGIPSNSKAVEAANSLKAQILDGTLKTQGLEGLSVGNPPSTLAFGTATAAVSGGGLIDNNPFDEGDPDEFLGRFNTTAGGANFWETNSSFSLDFGTTFSFSAFGFYGTDFGDFDGIFQLDLLTVDNQVRTWCLFGMDPASGSCRGRSSNPSPADQTQNGTLEFIGFFDNTTSYRGLRFTITQSGQDDFLGFDDFFLGDVAQTPPVDLPEPGSLALVGASLLGLAAARRRKTA
jgi:hypothetical protein